MGGIQWPAFSRITASREDMLCCLGSERDGNSSSDLTDTVWLRDHPSGCGRGGRGHRSGLESGAGVSFEVVAGTVGGLIKKYCLK